MSAARSLLALALAVIPLSAGAQIPITLGRPVVGRLLPADPAFSDSSHYRMYAFVGTKGDTITADMASDDFDANLILMDASGNVLRKDDDGGGTCNAHLSYVLPSTANYRLYANSSASSELGEYRLSVVKGSRPAAKDSTCLGFGRVAGMIQIGQSVNGRLTDHDPLLSDTTYYQRWILPVQMNQTFTVDLVSDDFDSFMRLAHGRGEKLVDNDDGGGGCNARIVYTATDDHPLRILVNTIGKRATGRFTLKVSEGELPTEAKGNCRFSSNETAAAPRPNRGAGGGHTITVGQSVTGQLTTADELFSDTTYMQHWSFTATPGQDVTIDLASDDFDPFIMIDGPGLSEFVGDEHSGPGCAARISRTFPQAGPYDIQVNTTTHPRRQTGHFVLSITQGHKPDVNDSCSPPTGNGGGLQASEGPLVRSGDAGGAPEHRIAVGQSVQGKLTTQDVLLRSDSTYAQAWTIQASAGQTITIDVESDDFDAYLFVRGPGISGGREFQDDDSGGNCNARLTVTFPQSGGYDLVVNTQGKYATGAFSISVTTGSKPKSLARCSRGG